MNSRVGLWIDHRNAFIVNLSDGHVTTGTVPSHIRKHLTAGGGSRSSSPYGPQDVVADDKIDRKYKHRLSRYYEDVLRALRGVQAVFIMGPGEAKDEFKRHLEHHWAKHMPNVTIEAADKLTKPQIIARVKEHFPC